MKKVLVSILIFTSTLMAAATPKDSISSFTFQRMALLEDYDCDACGCSASGGSLGFSSMLNANFVGVRYFYQNYESRDGIFANSPWIKENFNTIQAWARIPVTENIQISTLIPYHFNNRELSTGEDAIAGLGDITVMGLYKLWATKSDSAVVNQSVTLGVGLKMPTGKFSEVNNLGTVNQSFQLGTGSWDFPFVAEYVVKRNELGLNTMFNYIVKTENKDSFQYGNQFNYASTLFYLFDLNSVQLVPQAGIAGEVYNGNKQFNLDVPNTAGDVLFSKFGIEVGKDKFSLGVNAMLPINQNLSNGAMEAKYRWSVNLNYTL